MISCVDLHPYDSFRENDAVGWLNGDLVTFDGN